MADDASVSDPCWLRQLRRVRPSEIDGHRTCDGERAVPYRAFWTDSSRNGINPLDVRNDKNDTSLEDGGQQIAAIAMAMKRSIGASRWADWLTIVIRAIICATQLSHCTVSHTAGTKHTHTQVYVFSSYIVNSERVRQICVRLRCGGVASATCFETGWGEFVSGRKGGLIRAMDAGKGESHRELLFLLWLLLGHASTRGGASGGRRRSTGRHRRRSAAHGMLRTRLAQRLFLASILHLQHERQIEGFKSVEEYRRVCFELDALAAGCYRWLTVFVGSTCLRWYHR